MRKLYQKITQKPHLIHVPIIRDFFLSCNQDIGHKISLLLTVSFLLQLQISPAFSKVVLATVGSPQSLEGY